MAPRHEPIVQIASASDIAVYVELAEAAQAFLRSKGLSQWVPAAHPAFLPDLVAKVERGSLSKVCDGRDAIAFFDFSFEPRSWDWLCHPQVSSANAREAGAEFLRLDCHAENDWLCEYYRSQGFTEVASLEQHPGYYGVLWQKLVHF